MVVSYELISRRIRELRVERGLSQAQLAERADTTMPYINHIEKGRKKPSLEMLISIAVALDVSIDILLHGNQVSQKVSCSLEINDLLEDCDVYEQRVLIQTVRALKQILKDERVLQSGNAHRGF